MRTEMQRMQYTAEQRAEALELLATVGKGEACRQTGIPEGTIASWGSRAGVASPAPSDGRQAVARAHKAVVTAERKAALAGRMLAHAERMLVQLEQPVIEKVVKVVSDGYQLGQSTEIVEVKYDRPPTGDQKRIVEAVAILVDKIQLLTGEATSRPDLFRSAEPVEREQLLATVHQLADRVAS